MLFRKRFDRAREYQRHVRGLDKEEDQKKDEVPEEEDLRPPKQEEKVKLERGDTFAMLLAAFYTLFLPALGVLLLVIAVAYLFFRLF
jgi:hypothetical protein